MIGGFATTASPPPWIPTEVLVTEVIILFLTSSQPGALSDNIRKTDTVSHKVIVFSLAFWLL